MSPKRDYSFETKKGKKVVKIFVLWLVVVVPFVRFGEAIEIGPGFYWTRRANKFYPYFNYTGSRQREFNVSGSYEKLVEFWWSQSVTEDDDGGIWIADAAKHCIIYKQNGASHHQVFAGLCNNPGYHDGSVQTAKLREPQGVAVRKEWTPKADAPIRLQIFIADTGNHCVRKIYFIRSDPLLSRVETIGGHPSRPGLVDGPGELASFKYPRSLGVSKEGLVFVLDNDNEIRLIDQSGFVLTLVGGACQKISRKLIAANPVPLDMGLRKTGCRTHVAACGPRHHPLIRDENSDNLLINWEERLMPPVYFRMKLSAHELPKGWVNETLNESTGGATPSPPDASPSGTEVTPSSNEMPPSSTEAPPSPVPTEAAASTTEVSSSSTEAAASTTQVPSSSTEAAASTTEVPSSSTEAAASTTEVPSSSTEAAASTTESPPSPTETSAASGQE